MHSGTWNGIFAICLVVGALVAWLGFVTVRTNEWEATTSVIPVFAVTGLLTVAACLLYFVVEFFFWARPELFGTASPGPSATSAAPTAVQDTVKAGDTTPLFLDLGGFRGNHIVARGYPVSLAIDCRKPPADPTGSSVAAGGDLQYNQKTGHYDYEWKTDPAWRGSCRALVFKFGQDVQGLAGGTFTMDVGFK